ncbi:hypothetical protein E4T56_gene20264 [Termitomyces sp. T112]|nr:hypothetical protein E4T56_gene20264 [Termitomyces sp. T112]
MEDGKRGDIRSEHRRFFVEIGTCKYWLGLAWPGSQVTTCKSLRYPHNFSAPTIICDLTCDNCSSLFEDPYTRVLLLKGFFILLDATLPRGRPSFIHLSIYQGTGRLVYFFTIIPKSIAGSLIQCVLSFPLVLPHFINQTSVNPVVKVQPAHCSPDLYPSFYRDHQDGHCLIAVILGRQDVSCLI